MMSEVTQDQEKEREKQDKEMYDEDLLIRALHEEDLDLFRSEFVHLHSYDQAKFFSKIDEDLRNRLYHYLSPEEMAELFESLDIDEEDYQGILAEMNPTYAAEMLSNMYADDAVDVLNELDKDQVVSYLTIMDDESAKEIKELLHYEEYTAGSIMTTEFVAISKNQTCDLRCTY